MVQIIDTICKILAGGSVLLMALSFMYVFAIMAFKGGVVGPPPTMFMGMFGVFAAMLLYGGTHLLVGDLFRV